MKTYIDFCATMQAELTAKLKLASQLKRLWGTTTVDGIEVYNSQFTIWPGTETENVKKVLKLFNIPISTIQNQSKDGITRLYLYFNSTKIDSTTYSKEAIATLLETDISFNTERVFTLTYTDTTNPAKFAGWTTEQINTFVNANLDHVTGNSVTSTEDLTVDNIDNVIGSYILLDTSGDFTKTLISASVTAVPNTTTIKGFRDPIQSYSTAIVLKYKYKRVHYLNHNSSIVLSIYNDLTTRTSLANGRVSGIREILHASVAPTNLLWYKGYLRTEAAKLLNKHDYTNLVFGSLDTGYDQKKKKGWLTILAIVIVIAVTVLTWGTTTAAAAAAAGEVVSTTAMLTAIAVTASAVTLALTVYSMILAKYGETGEAAYMGRWIKITGIVALATGIAAAYQTFMQNAAKEAIASGAETAAVGSADAAAMSSSVTIGDSVISTSNISVGNMIEGGTKMFTSSMENSTWLSKLSMASKVVNPIMEWREKNKMSELTSMSDEYKKQQAALVEECDSSLHIGIEDIRMSTKPLTQSNIMYQVDYLYEPTRFNICRNSFVGSGMNIIS